MTRAEYEALLAKVDRLFDAKPGTPDDMRLGRLVDLVEEYETEHWPVPDDPVFVRYKGYLGRAEWQERTGTYAGDVRGIRGSVTFQAGSREDLLREMSASVDSYLALCTERGIEPSPPWDANS